MTANTKETCPRCALGELITDTESGERLCPKCGLVITEKLQEAGPECRSFPTDEELFGELNRLKDKLVISDAVIERAAYIYRKDLEKHLARYRDTSPLLASALYAACRYTSTPRTLKEVGAATNIKRKDIARCYRWLFKELELKTLGTDPIQCVGIIASKIGIEEKTKRHAIEVLRLAQKNKISAGKAPMGLAAAALYLACVKNGEYKTQRDIADAANVTEVTIRNRCKGLKELLDL